MLRNLNDIVCSWIRIQDTWRINEFFTIYANVIACISKKEIIISFKSLTRLFLIFYPQEMNSYLYVCATNRETREGAPADCWNWGEWWLEDYKWKRSFLGWFFGLVMPVQEIFVLPWLLLSAQYKIFFSSPCIFSIPLSPSPTKRGRELCWVFCL